MQVLLVRHGQSVNNRSFENQGEANRVADPGLTELGFAQSRALADWLVAAGLVPDRIFASLMRRSIETAGPIGSRFGVPVEVRDDIHENAGPFDGEYADGVPHPGLARAELAELADDLVFPSVLTEDGWWAGSMETAQGALQRAIGVSSWVMDLAGPTNTNELVVIVSHGAFLSMLLTALLDPSLAAEAAERDDLGAADLPQWFTFDNTSTVLLEITTRSTPKLGREKHLRVGWVNRIDHLLELAGHEPSLATFAFPPPPGRSQAVDALHISPPPHVDRTKDNLSL